MSIHIFMTTLALHICATTVHWEDNTSCISVVEDKMVTTRVKHIDITVCFLQEKYDNDPFVPKYVKSSVMPVDICTKPYSGPIISWITKWMTGFKFYPTSATENYQLMRLNEVVAN